ncbi:MAG: DUF4405 domain-containing protein, partial [Rhodobacterales bacterium]|nr:DUF4405 domain-containing protein [Rhodobacterales bacterium]
MANKGFSWRSLVAFIVTWAFVIMTITGLVLYVVPQGRIANWTDWTLAALTKDDWAHVHMLFGGLFIVAGVLHLIYNWKPFKKYLADRVAGHLHLRQELVVSLIAAVLLLGTAVWQVPPVSWVFQWNDDIKDWWADRAGAPPPFGHAEEASLALLARQLGVDPDETLARLEAAGIRVASPLDTLLAIADANGLTPEAVYTVMAPPKAKGAKADTKAEGDKDAFEAKFAGSGVGRKSVADAAADLGVPVD